MSARQLIPGLALALVSTAVHAELVYNEASRTTALEVKLGGYKPLIDREASLTGRPYDDTFGASSMLLFEIEGDRFLWQKVGAAGVGLSFGYAEKYAPAKVAGDPSILANESTALKVLPLRVMGLYRLDYAALHLDIPLVPYVKAGLVVTPWWVTKGGKLEFVEGSRSVGVKYGYGFTGGISLMLDYFEPRLAKDFHSDLGVDHSYIFAEFTYENVNNFGRPGLDLSSRHWMFGFSLDY